jgi:hypothetical protein
MALTTHPHLAPRLKNEYSYTSIPLLSPHGLLWGDYLLLRGLHAVRVTQRMAETELRIMTELEHVQFFLPTEDQHHAHFGSVNTVTQ